MSEGGERIEIYYFSGTGNSLAVARDIAGKTGGRLVSIPSSMKGSEAAPSNTKGSEAAPSMMDSERITTDADVMGVIFPVYHKSIPLILKRFVEKMERLDKKYIFGVCTYGDTPGLATRHLGELVQSRGGQLAAGFGVHMPYNYITPSLVLKDFFSSFTLREIPVEKQQALFASAQEKIESIAAFVSARKSGTFEITADILTRLADTLNLYETLGKSVWLKIAGVDEQTDLSFLESRQLMDRAFQADEKCNGCGICSRVCPVGDIRMVDDAGEPHRRPVWQHHCEQCFACLQWCPQEAIQFGSKTSGGKRYHHPDVKLADMFRSSSKD
jgi:ferredoxin/NAD(P)H-dependent FMN reductase